MVLRPTGSRLGTPLGPAFSGPLRSVGLGGPTLLALLRPFPTRGLPLPLGPSFDEVGSLSLVGQPVLVVGIKSVRGS